MEKGALEKLVKKVVGRLKKTARFSEEEMAGAWKEAAGARAASRARPVSLRKSVLVVNVDDSSWLYELTTKKKDILKKLSSALRSRKIKDIRFRIGEIKENAKPQIPNDKPGS